MLKKKGCIDYSSFQDRCASQMVKPIIHTSFIKEQNLIIQSQLTSVCNACKIALLYSCFTYVVNIRLLKPVRHFTDSGK